MKRKKEGKTVNVDRGGNVQYKEEECASRSQKRNKERHEEIRLRKIIHISSSEYFKEQKQRESSKKTVMEKQKQSISLFILTRRNQGNMSAHHKAVPNHHN